MYLQRKINESESFQNSRENSTSCGLLFPLFYIFLIIHLKHESFIRRESSIANKTMFFVLNFTVIAVWLSKNFFSYSFLCCKSLRVINVGPLIAVGVSEYEKIFVIIIIKNNYDYENNCGK